MSGTWKLCLSSNHLGNVAERMTWKRYGSVGGRGEGNAYQHIVWAMVMTVEFGSRTARGFLNRHEDVQQRRGERQMDLHNNDLGLWFGSILRSRERLRNGDRGRTQRRIHEVAMYIISSGLHRTL